MYVCTVVISIIGRSPVLYSDKLKRVLATTVRRLLRSYYVVTLSFDRVQPSPRARLDSQLTQSQAQASDSGDADRRRSPPAFPIQRHYHRYSIVRFPVSRCTRACVYAYSNADETRGRSTPSL